MLETVERDEVAGRAMRTIWLEPDGASVEIIDQTRLPHRVRVNWKLATLARGGAGDPAMLVRGAPLIGAAAAYGMALAMGGVRAMQGSRACGDLRSRRGRRRSICAGRSRDAGGARAVRAGRARWPPLIARRGDLRGRRRDQCAAIGDARPELLEAASGRPEAGGVNILTHCNAGWLATVDWGTALAPIYMAHDAGIPVHVWVDETRPRNQGATDGLGTGAAWRAAYGDRRQCRRPSDAARRRWTSASSAPTARQPRAMSATRSAPT